MVLESSFSSVCVWASQYHRRRGMQSTGVKMGKKKATHNTETEDYARMTEEPEMRFQQETITNLQIKPKNSGSTKGSAVCISALYLYQQSLTLRHLNSPRQHRGGFVVTQDLATFGQNEYLVGEKLIRSILPISLFKVTTLTSFHQRKKNKQKNPPVQLRSVELQ